MKVNIVPYTQCGLDIGGTLAKIVVYEKTKNQFNFDCLKEIPGLDLDMNNNFSSEKQLRFRFTETLNINLLIQWLKYHGIKNVELSVTGGGSFKFQNIFKEQLNIIISKKDEMISLMKGLSYLMNQSNEIFRYDLTTKQLTSVTLSKPLYPYLLINIGSGVSILKAEGPNDFKRVTGTCIGGGTVLGLARLLLGVSTFQEVIDLSRSGSNNLDLVVSDLLGDAAGSRFLPRDTLASSFGRLYCSTGSPLDSQSIKPEDIARSLVYMVAYNLGYLSYLVGTIQKTYRCIFSGKFIQNHSVTMEAITEAITFYTTHYDLLRIHDNLQEQLQQQQTNINLTNLKTTVISQPKFEILFLKHDGYLGAIGALLLSSELHK